MTNGKTYHIRTFGCQMNIRDSETAAGILEEMGYAPSDDISNADIILFNTCCIRELAEKKAESAIGSTKIYKNQDASKIVGVFGCMTQQDSIPQELSSKFPHIDFVFGTNNLHMLPSLIDKAESGKKSILEDEGHAASGFDLPVRHNTPPLAYVNIVFGCNNYCSYCIVPFVRGREVSRPRALIVDEARKLAGEGYSEITLLGQNVNSYGLDNGDSFASLLRELSTTGIPRIRFMTSHPKDLSDDMISTMAECKAICNSIHLPVQSGSDSVLKSMNRRYDYAHYMGLIKKLRSAMPGIGITTDIIVGFPGETQSDFEDTLSLVRKVGYDSAFMFAFSPRRGTKAADLPGQLDAQIKQERLQKLIDMQAEISLGIHKSLEGQVFDVLVEACSKKDTNHVTGRIERGITVNFPGTADLIGKMISVEITEGKRNTLFGRRV